MLLIFGIIATICIIIGVRQFLIIRLCDRVEAIIKDEAYGYWENIPIRFPVYEYKWNNREFTYTSHFYDEALNESSVTLYIDNNGTPHELKSMIVPIICGLLLGLMVVLKIL